MAIIFTCVRITYTALETTERPSIVGNVKSSFDCMSTSQSCKKTVIPMGASA